MITQEQFSKTPMGKAVIELSEEMSKRNMPPVTINVVGGFALMMNDIRDPDCMTDIDYVGNPLPDDFNDLADKIGIKHKLGKGWINNDVMLTGSSMEDFEFATGKLHFDKSMDVGGIKINILNEKDILRMKLIAVDTSIMAAEDGGDFSRIKDLPDVSKLLKLQHIDCDQIMDKYEEYILSDHTPRVIKAYQDGGNAKALEYVDELGKKHAELLKKRADRQEARTPLLDSMMSNLYARYEREKAQGLDDDIDPFNLPS